MCLADGRSCWIGGDKGPSLCVPICWDTPILSLSNYGGARRRHHWLPAPPPRPLPGTPPAYHVSITSFPWEGSRGQGGDPMWQKLRLYCACRWGRASRLIREAHAGPEPGASALSSECSFQGRRGGSFATLPTGMNLRGQAVPPD